MSLALRRLVGTARAEARLASYRHVRLPTRRAYAHPSAPPPRRRQPEPQPIDPSHPIGEAASSAHASASQPSNAGKNVFYTFGAVFGLYATYVAVQTYRAAVQPCHNPEVADLGQQKDVNARYEDIASSFDADVGFSEFIGGTNRIRKRLAQKCHGDVLEVSCGTGRNLGYYDIQRKDGKVDSLGFIDLSPQMVEVCRKKWDALFAKKIEKKQLKDGLKVSFMTGSALGDMPLASGGKKYDTIYQTMGLCSTPSPTELVMNMAKHLDVSKPESRILLLEHGRSYMPWLNNILDNSAAGHAERYGCWFNRDIGQLVEEAAEKSGMEVASERRYHFGTLWLFELKPKDETVMKAAASKPGPHTDVAAEQKPATGWFSKLGWT